MELVGRDALDRYLIGDTVSKRYSALGEDTLQRQLKCQLWLEATPAKRMIFSRLYGDILEKPSYNTIVDVGGGLTALTPALAANADYWLIDPLHHDTHEHVSAVLASAHRLNLQRCDWLEATPKLQAQILIANDLFPNVDQRLSLFLDWAIPRSLQIRLSLTFYNSPRWYQTQRVGGEEQLCVLAYDGIQTRQALLPHASRIDGWRPDVFETREPSVFPNGRHVVLVTLRGGA